MNSAGKAGARRGVTQKFWQPIGESPTASSSLDPATAIGLGIELGLHVRARRAGDQ